MEIHAHLLINDRIVCMQIRLSLGDPDYVNVTAPINALLSDEYMSDLQRLTKDDSVLPLDAYGGIFNMSAAIADDHGTTHLSVVDRDGNAVAMTSTINTYFGSKVISPSTGKPVRLQLCSTALS
jgi:gamma-glutamyltranspeptidase / glutathione hydrolase / leukotriene-C4 hydrolase